MTIMQLHNKINKEELKKKLMEEFGAEVEIISAEKSHEQKARNAAPGKPAIVLS